MKKDYLHYDVRKARIYKDVYRSSSKPSRFFGTLLSIILQGQSPVGGGLLYRRRH
ncbi:hypothetical protein [Puia dinghuensis]|uniref:hypothetical protein n=1 Tax=Puia dinghuensis TaxID=1792502 RepID=UPI001665D9E9|nr:hypothetical protein [Puia dinghuensis]